MRHSAVRAQSHPVRSQPSAGTRLALRGQSAVPQAAEHERRRLARELHDGPIQEVLAAGLAIDLCLAELPPDSPVAVGLEQARRLTGQAMRRLRSSLQRLRDGADDADGADGADTQLPDMLRRLQAGHPARQPEVGLEVTGRPLPLTPEIRESLFRAASECVFNAAVHGGARRVVIRLGYGPGFVGLCVADDGHGEPDAVARVLRGEVPGTGEGYHYGLADVAARAEEMGWTVSSGRSDLGGVAVTVLAPQARPDSSQVARMIPLTSASTSHGESDG